MLGRKNKTQKNQISHPPKSQTTPKNPNQTQKLSVASLSAVKQEIPEAAAGGWCSDHSPMTNQLHISQRL